MTTTSKRFWHGCAWGLAATIVMSALLLIAWGLRIIPTPIPLSITVGIVARVFGAQPLNPGVLILATIIQLAYGSFWGGVLATGRSTVGAAVAVGIGLWLIMMIFYMPMAGLEVFDLATNGLLWLVTLLGHIVYGYTLGRLLVRDQARHPPLWQRPSGAVV